MSSQNERSFSMVNVEIDKIILEAEEAGPENALTLDLSHLNLREVPYAQLERIQNRISRLALGHNLLRTIGPEILNFTRLRYLNIRSNAFREFPEVLCRLESLEILDISRNKIRELPQSFGHLMNIRVLSISKNRLIELPSYFSYMPNLEILKLESNHIIYPPPHIVNNELQEHDMPMFIANIKGYLLRNESLLRSHPYNKSSPNLVSNHYYADDTDIPVPSSAPMTRSLTTVTADPRHSSHSSHYLTSESFFNSSNNFPKAISNSRLSPKDQYVPQSIYSSNNELLSTIGNEQNVSPMSPFLNNRLEGSKIQARPKRSVSLATGLSSSSLSKPVPMLNDHIPHSPHNSNFTDGSGQKTPTIESPNEFGSSTPTLKSIPHQSAPLGQSTPTSSPERKTTERIRSNSINDELYNARMPSSVLHRVEGLKEHRNMTDHPLTRNLSHDSHLPGVNRLKKEEFQEGTENVNAYFSTRALAREPITRPSYSEKVLESCRGILFALSQVQQSIRQQLLFCNSPIILDTMRHVSFTTNTHIKRLIRSFEEITFMNDGIYNASPVIHTCLACIGSFRKLIDVTKKFSSEFVNFSDLRYTRLFLLVLFGATKELQNSYQQLCLGAQDPLKQSPTNPARNNPPMSATSSRFNLEKPTTALKSDFAKQLQEQIELATSSATSVLCLLVESIEKNTLPSDVSNENLGSNTVAKLKELAMLSNSASEVTRKLKGHSKAYQESSSDENEWQRLLDDTQMFVKSIIAVANLAKTVSSEYTFQKNIISGLSAVTRSTKDLTILISSSSHHSNHGADSASVAAMTALSPIMRVPATPLSAALGSAAQSITPLIMSPSIVPSGGHRTDYFTDGDLEALQR
ncbi:MOR signaling network scaffold, leucine-rich repeat protein Sog2 [Schizosaccharomyces osmophilus]|uniref:MOR signaling network scaffold, leucine-rich repeat protein Sog2 n=1 Tax=Schizosaccharomyces osmophilus TaxID=2545709 RepID=A0AAE9WFT6_9SCHI|nr:MOR signaling network scaffold, leucine-rich repeat protein Sog2 [Schizosaccharomyces osmophilus]WBW75626.1 MOR signaling network scaffold, leucine-rich repeat protein Sog2 [Schizosaccharomyces osmophilus]